MGDDAPWCFGPAPVSHGRCYIIAVPTNANVEPVNMQMIASVGCSELNDSIADCADEIGGKNPESPISLN